MAPIVKKRSRDEISLKSRKRQRSNQKHDAPTVKDAVDLDKLKWNAVDFPQNFEDAEGFFGLEEISDVDVVKDPQAGRVEYKARQKVDVNFQKLTLPFSYCRRSPPARPNKREDPPGRTARANMKKCSGGRPAARRENLRTF